MKVGDYVRTKSGGIGKIIEIDNNASCSHIITNNETFGLGWDGEQVNWDFITEIVKSSPNIIDLIEDGDYVNGVEVIGFEKDNDNKEYLQCGVGDYVVCTYYEEDIKLILTKKMYSSVEYRLED